MNWLSFFYGAGGQFFDNKGNLTINSPEGLKATQTMVDILYEHNIANESILTYRPDDARVLFQQERAVFLMVQDFVWAPLTADDSPVKDKVDFTRNPYFEGQPKGHSTALGGFLLAINAHSEHKQEAADLIRYFTSYGAQLKAALSGGRAPTLSAVYGDLSLAEKRPDLAKLGKNFAVGVVRPSARTGALYPQVSEIMQMEITAALHRQKTPEQALEELKKLPDYGSIDFVRQVTTDAPYEWEPDLPVAGSPYNIIVLDCGLKYTILRMMRGYGCRVTAVP